MSRTSARSSSAINPSSTRHTPAILAGFRFHEGRHTHATWLTEDGISEVARRARLEHKMKGMGRVYDHVTPEMERQISEALEERFLSSVLALEEDERQALVVRVPVIRDTVERAQRETEMLTARLVGDEQFSQISPTGPTNENRSGAEAPPDLRILLVELRGFEPLTSSMPFTPSPPRSHPALLRESGTVHWRPSLLIPVVTQLDTRPGGRQPTGGPLRCEGGSRVAGTSR